MRVAALIATLLCIPAGACARPVDDTSISTTSTNGFLPVAPTFAEPGVDDLLGGLRIAPERSDAGYDRGLFDYWTDDDEDGCDTRCEVLEQERRTDLPGLGVGWESIYDGHTTGNPAELDVDHVVALAEAWRSGADTWSPDRRRALANDLDEPDALIAVTASTNASKGDQDAANWRPPDQASWCQWAHAIVTVKVKWGLTADPAEARSLREFLAGC